MPQKGRNGGITASTANTIFLPLGVVFEKNEVEGVYIATHPAGEVIRRPTLTACCQAVCENWLQVTEVES